MPVFLCPHHPCRLQSPLIYFILILKPIIRRYYHSNMFCSSPCWFSSACVGPVKLSCSEWVSVDMFCRISMLLEFVFLLTSPWHAPYECYSLPSRVKQNKLLFFFIKVKTQVKMLSEMCYFESLLKLTIAFILFRRMSCPYLHWCWFGANA